MHQIFYVLDFSCVARSHAKMNLIPIDLFCPVLKLAYHVTVFRAVISTVSLYGLDFSLLNIFPLRQYLE